MKLEVINRESGKIRVIECDEYHYEKENHLVVYRGKEEETLEELIPTEEVRFCDVYSKDAAPYCGDCAISMEDVNLANIEAPMTCEGCGELVASDV